MNSPVATGPRRIALTLQASSLWSDDAAQGCVRFCQRSRRFDILDMPFCDAPELPAKLNRVRPAGVILSMSAAAYAEIQADLPRNLPTVSINAELLGPAIPGVCSDDRAMVDMMLDHLRAAGYEHIAFVGPSGSTGARRRIKILQELAAPLAVHEDECRPSDAVGEEIPLTPELERWLASLKTPVGIITWNGSYAECIAEGCRRLGLNVPKDVGTISVVNGRRCLFADPPISAIDAGGDKLGYEAMKLLVDVMDGAAPRGNLHQFAPRGIVARKSTERISSQESDHVRRALDYINAHACQGIDISDVLRATQTISRRKFYDDFTRLMGRSPAEQINHVKFTKAQELLTQTTLSITRISGMCGFQTGAYFSDAFRKYVGQTPRAFRQSPKKKKPRSKSKR